MLSEAQGRIRHRPRTSITLPRRSQNQYTHTDLDVIHARLARSNLSAVVNHGLRLDDIRIAMGLAAQCVQNTVGRSDEHASYLQLEFKSLLETLVFFGESTDSASQTSFALDSKLIASVNADIHQCCAVLQKHLDDIQRQSHTRLFSWLSRVSGWNWLDEKELADFKVNLSRTRKSLRGFLLELTETFDSYVQYPMPFAHLNRLLSYIDSLQLLSTQTVDRNMVFCLRFPPLPRLLASLTILVATDGIQKTIEFRTTQFVSIYTSSGSSC